MSPRKLTNDNKQEILKLYRETGETTSTLADRYGVSSSTISRFLKTHLRESEYEDLIQQKRLARTPKGVMQLESEQDSEEVSYPSLFADFEPQTAPKPLEKPIILATEVKPVTTPVADIYPPYEEEEEEEEEDLGNMDVAALGEMFGEDLLDLDEDDEDIDEEDDDEWEQEREIDYPKPIAKTAQVQILPISAASFPKTCYLVIDRAAELITRPLREFADLGRIPSEEVQQKTLPIFDNHRVARRFSKRRERVIKVPDGRLIQKTRTYLEAKGITRLLLDGQIYSL